MPGEALPNGDGNTLAFTTSVPYLNERVFVGGLFQPPIVNYTYVGTTLTFLPAAFPFSPTPGAPGSGDSIYITGDVASVGTSGGAISTGRDYTSTELIASVQQRAFIGLSPRDFGAPQILRLFNEEIDGYLVPFVAQRRMEFWVESVDLAISGGASAYPIPSVAMGGKLRALAYLVGGIPFLIDQIDLPVAVARPLIPTTVQYPSKYYFIGNSVVLWPTPSMGGTLRLFYYRRPAMLVLPSQCLQVTGFPAGAPGGYWRIGFNGALPSAYTANALIDLVGNVPNFTTYASGQVIHATGAGYVELPGAQPSGLSVGDWLCLAGTAPVVTGSPADLVNLLVQYVALKVSEAKGANETVQRLASGLAKAESSAGWTIQQRNDGSMRKISAFPSDGWGG